MIDYDLFKNIEQYAEQHFKSSIEHYKKGYTYIKNERKIFDFILNGKIAEYNLYFHLKNENFILNEPDLKIYTTGKSFDSDLIILGKENELFQENEKIHIHVKGITKKTYENFGSSFLLQKNDPIVIDQKNEKYKNHYFAALHQTDNFLVYDNIKKTSVSRVN